MIKEIALIVLKINIIAVAEFFIFYKVIIIIKKTIKILKVLIKLILNKN